MDLDPAIRDIFLIGLYTGMRMGEVVSLRWERLDLERHILRVEETKTGEPLELPITRQLAAIFERRRADADEPDLEPGGWLFPAPGRPRRVTSRTFRSSIPILARPGEPASGSTACATPSSRWPNANSCCRVR